MFDSVPFPIALIPRIFREYAVPFVRPVMTKGELGTVAASQLEPLSKEYSKFVIGEPPEPPAVNETVRLPLPAVTVLIVGAEGEVAVLVEITFDSESLTPTTFTAFTFT
jgi:hypothetical protein